jgi:hypothetical protein
MGTARSTSATTPAPRKRTPRKTTPEKARPVVVDEPPAVTPVDPGAERIANLRHMLAAEGLDPDAVLAGHPTVTETPSEPAQVEGQVIGPVPEYSREFEPIPGVDLDGVLRIIVDARKNPVTAETIIDGLRSLIVENGHDPDLVIAAALGAETVSEPTVQPNGLVNAVVDFRGRQIEVTAPEIEQVMVIRRMQSLFANAAKMKEITADEAIRLMDRALKAVCSVIVNSDDVEFLEDLLLTRQAKIEETLPLLRESLQALERANVDNGNRADRRKAAKSSGKTGRAALATAVE